MSDALPLGSVIGILGGGQLGRMLSVAASRLGFRTHIYEPMENPPAAHVADRLTTASYDDTEALRAFAETTGKSGSLPCAMRTVVVSMRCGAVSSSRAYLSPRGQVFPLTPVTAPSSSVAVISQPSGQQMQLSVFVSIAIFIPPLQWQL